jgi:hypothetical protein
MRLPWEGGAPGTSGGLEIPPLRLSVPARGGASRCKLKILQLGDGADADGTALLGDVSIHGVMRPSKTQSAVTAECDREDRWATGS